MNEVIGKCHCGKNQFKFSGEPEYQFTCYCKSCRHINSAGHLCGIMCDSENFIAADHTKTYSYPGGSGNDINLHFCPSCGTHLYAYPTEYPGKVVMRANTLTDYLFNSQQSLFTESAYVWDQSTQVSS